MHGTYSDGTWAILCLVTRKSVWHTYHHCTFHWYQSIGTYLLQRIVRTSSGFAKWLVWWCIILVCYCSPTNYNFWWSENVMCVEFFCLKLFVIILIKYLNLDDNLFLYGRKNLFSWKRKWLMILIHPCWYTCILIWENVWS